MICVVYLVGTAFAAVSDYMHTLSRRGDAHIAKDAAVDIYHTYCSMMLQPRKSNSSNTCCADGGSTYHVQKKV
jgi:hypothetical protein